MRQGLARAWTKIKIMQINGYADPDRGARRQERRRAWRRSGATNKMFWSEYHQQVMELAMDILGLAGPGADRAAASPSSSPATGCAAPRPGYPVSVLQSSFFFSRSETIWGGTAQIQRNIVGERILGLPREPRPAG